MAAAMNRHTGSLFKIPIGCGRIPFYVMSRRCGLFPRAGFAFLKVNAAGAYSSYVGCVEQFHRETQRF